MVVILELKMSWQVVIKRVFDFLESRDNDIVDR